MLRQCPLSEVHRIYITIWDMDQGSLVQHFPILFTWRNPENNFLYPEEPLPMKTFRGQKKLIAWSVIQLLLNYCKENLFVKS